MNRIYKETRESTEQVRKWCSCRSASYNQAARRCSATAFSANQPDAHYLVRTWQHIRLACREEGASTSLLPFVRGGRPEQVCSAAGRSFHFWGLTENQKSRCINWTPPHTHTLGSQKVPRSGWPWPIAQAGRTIRRAVESNIWRIHNTQLLESGFDRGQGGAARSV